MRMGRAIRTLVPAAEARKDLREQWPEQHHEREPGDAAHERIREEDAEIALRDQHGLPERVLGPITQHQCEDERRERIVELLEYIADDAEQHHQPDVEHRIMDR